MQEHIQIDDNKQINISLIRANNHKTKWSQQYAFSEKQIVQYRKS